MDITGLGTEVFDKYMQALLAIHHILSSHLPVESLQPVTPRSEKGDLILSSHNRYYTLQQDIQDPIIDFEKSIDPMGVLLANKPVDAEYTEDNRVEYFQRHTDVSE